jgi:RimJ/RimL family protein N-acetyltransferase
MANRIPNETVLAFARTIHQEAVKYGFSQVDTIRLINALMDISAQGGDRAGESVAAEHLPPFEAADRSVQELPLRSSRLRIRAAIAASDTPLFERWLADDYGRHFLLSCATAQHLDVAALLGSEHNHVGIIELDDGTPIGAMAFLDIDLAQRRAELRKLVGERTARGKGYAEEATALWIKYGVETLGLEKLFVSTLQTHLRNIKLNEAVGFRVEGVLRGEVLLGGERHDVLRMGLCAVTAGR